MVMTVTMSLMVRCAGFQNSIQLPSTVLSDVISATDATIVGDNGVLAILQENMDWFAVQGIAIGAKDVGFRSLAHDSSSRQNNHVMELLDGKVQTDALAWPKTPYTVGFVVSLVFARLIGQ